MSSYPGSIDSFSSKSDGPGNFLDANDINDITSAIVATQTALGPMLSNVATATPGAPLSYVVGGGDDNSYDTDQSAFVTLPELAGFVMPYPTDGLSYLLYNADLWFTVGSGDNGSNRCLFRYAPEDFFVGVTMITAQVLDTGGAPFVTAMQNAGPPWGIDCTPSLNSDSYLVHVQTRILLPTPPIETPSLPLAPQVCSSDASHVTGYTWAANLTGYYLLGQWAG